MVVERFRRLASQYHNATSVQPIPVFWHYFALSNAYLTIIRYIYGHATISEGWHLSTTMATQYNQIRFRLYFALNHVYLMVYTVIYGHKTISEGWHLSTTMAP